MSDLNHPFIEQVYYYAEDCYIDANATVDFLHQAIEALQAEDPQLREALSQSFIKADVFIDHCGAIVQELQQMLFKYCTAYSTSGLSPDLDLLTETLVGIERRGSEFLVREFFTSPVTSFVTNLPDQELLHRQLCVNHETIMVGSVQAC